jgi:hypothetical protein
MTAIARRSAKLPPNYGKQEVRDAVETLEDRPYIPRKTPVSGGNGYEGEICRDDSRGYIYSGGAWRYWTLTTL